MPLAARRTFFSTLRAASSARAPGGECKSAVEPLSARPPTGLEPVWLLGVGLLPVWDVVRRVRVTMVMGVLESEEWPAQAALQGIVHAQRWSAREHVLR
jgi:hypothetical protein